MRVLYLSEENGVTDQERDLLRIAAWDRYQTTKIEFLACKAKLRKFREPMRALVEKLLVDLLEISEQEVGFSRSGFVHWRVRGIQGSSKKIRGCDRRGAEV